MKTEDWPIVKIDRAVEDVQVTPDSRKDEVAAHQAVCGCHLADLQCCLRVIHADYPVEALDSKGSLWHLDLLCKVRPGMAVVMEPEPPVKWATFAPLVAPEDVES